MCEYKEGRIIYNASAGTGKTHTILKNIKGIVKKNGKDALKEMLLLSFSNAAVYELKERLMKKGENGEDPLIDPSNINDILMGMNIMTIHSFALFLMDIFKWEEELPADIEFLSDSEDNVAWKSAVKEYVYKNKEELEKFVPLKLFYDFVNTVGENIYYYSSLGMLNIGQCDEKWIEEKKEEIKNLLEKYLFNKEDKKEAQKEFYEKYNEQFTLFIIEKIKEIGDLHFVPKAYMAGKFPFNLTLYLIVKFIKNKFHGLDGTKEFHEYLKKHGLNIKYLFVDEAQDTDIIQMQLILSLFGFENNIGPKYVCIVGDKKQSIYAWRGAHPEGFEKLIEVFEKQDNAKKESLDTSYRIKNEELFNKMNDLIEREIEFDTFKDYYKENNNSMFMPYEDIIPKDVAKEEILEKINDSINEIVRNDKKIKIGILVRSRKTWEIYKEYFSAVNKESITDKIVDAVYLRYIEDIFNSKKGKFEKFIWQAYPFERINSENNIEKDSLDNKINIKNVDDLWEHFNEKEVWSYISPKEKRDLINFFITLDSYFMGTDLPLEELVNTLKDNMRSLQEFYSNSEDGGYIEVSTIHGSKGKTYDIVILLEPNGIFKNNSDPRKIDSDKMFLVDSIDNIESDNPTINAYYSFLQISTANEAKGEFVEAIREKKKQEQKNLYYVAITRASQRLIMLQDESQKGNKGKGYGSEFKMNILFPEKESDKWKWQKIIYKDNRPINKIMINRESVRGEIDDKIAHISNGESIHRSIAIILGILGHHLAEKGLLYKDFEYINEYDFYKNIIEDHKLIDKILINEDYKKIKDNINDYEVFAEKPLYRYDIKKKILKKGIADIIIKTGDNMQIVEFKFTEDGKIKKEYESQLEEYKEIVSKMGINIDKKLIVFSLR